MILHGAADMLGWVPGVGGKLKQAAKAFDTFRDSVNAALGGISPKTVPVTVSFNGVNQGSITGNTFTSTTGFTYAKGGKIPGWLGTPNKDSVPILAMGGEFIVNKQSTKKHQKLLESINSGDVKTYAKGGMVGFARAATGDMGLAAHIDVAREVKVLAEAYAKAYNSSTFPRGLSWARTQIGKPYQWGGDNNPSWDCSGFMSAIESVIRGEAPHRRWATGAFSGATAPPNWRLNAQSPFMIGITNAGVGHTAGTLLGTNVEMTVPVARMGGAARGAADGMFPDHYGLVGFDRGGWLKPGVNHVWNGTGRPERVPNPTRGHDGELHVHVHNHGVIGSQREMQDWLSESLDELNRRGRLRGLTGP
jgi:preprotein translocase subunit YajC